MNEPSSGPPNPRHARYRQVPVHWSGSPVTAILIVACCIVAVLSKLGYDSSPVSWMYFAEVPHQEELEALLERLTSIEANGGDDGAEYEVLLERFVALSQTRSEPFAQIGSGQLWRLVTPAFLHFGPIHLLFNMMWLWTLGRPLESVLRRTRFVLLVIAIAVISNVAQAVMGGSTNFGGMSGVVYGFLGFVWVHGRLNPAGGLAIDPRTVRFMLIWLVLCFTGMVGPIANWAHSFGLLAGAALGAVHALRNGGWKMLQRRQEFRRAVTSGGDSLHHCAVCARTERQDPNLEFRVGEDGEEYCVEHLPKGED